MHKLAIQYQRFHRTLRLFSLFIIAAFGIPDTVRAAGHADVTVISMGSGQVNKDQPEESWRLPMGPTGPLSQALVLIGSQPKAPKEFKFPMSQPADPNAPPELEQVPATVKFTIAGQELPPWELHPFVTGYVINLDIIKRNPEYALGRLALKTELSSRADQVGFAVVGMPDPLLLNETLNGPLADFFNAAQDSDLKAYFKALATEIGGDSVTALLEYRKLASSGNERLAQLARRGVRLFGFETRPRKLTGNFQEHWRWALYLQQCGLYGPAYSEFNECRIIFPNHAESQFRAGEMLDRLNPDQFKVINYMERSAESLRQTLHSPWYTLLVILESRNDKTLTDEQIFDLKGDWVVAERMIEAATRGAVQIVTTTYEMPNEAEWGAAKYAGKIPGPPEGLIRERGWFDGVIFVRPRAPGDHEPDVLTAGGDAGPKGAAVSCLYADATWKEFLQAWYQQYSWAARVGEVGEGFPIGDELWDCGHQPAAHEAYSLRAGLHYDFTPAMAFRPKMTDVSPPDSHVRSWRIQGPYPVGDSGGADGSPAHHVLDPLNAGPAVQTISIISKTDFIDLKKIFPKAGPALAQATCWVYSPEDQDVRMWLGQNDGAAAWLNGRCIHEGRYYSANRYEDKNIVDTVASHALLRQGWNELRLVVESWPAPRDHGWGFSVRFCDWRGKSPPGLAYLNDPPVEGLAPKYAPPPAGEYYSWQQIKNDAQELLPRLSAADLRRITGIPTLSMDGAVDKNGGHFIIASPDKKASSTYRALSSTWQSGKDRDVHLNNVLDWNREACAALAFEKAGRPHTLLFLKPEALTAYTTLLNEPSTANSVFKGRALVDRFLGYVVVPCPSSTRTLFVLDTFLGDESQWPKEEEDLLNPIGPFIPNPKDLGPRP